MSETIEQLEHRIASAGELRDITGAMRAMAAARLQEATTALPAIRAYAATVTRALAEVIALAAAPPARTTTSPGAVLVCFAPEHGFVGTLAERVAAAAAERSPERLLMVGDRGADALGTLGKTADAALALAPHLESMPALARQVVERCAPWVASGAVGAMDLLYPAHDAAGSPRITLRRLLPVPFATPERAGPPALTNLPAASLLPALVDEYLVGEVMHAAVETLASENAARLAVTDAARHNVEETLQALGRQRQIARQTRITAEIAEVVAGVLRAESDDAVGD